MTAILLHDTTIDGAYESHISSYPIVYTITRTESSVLCVEIHDAVAVAERRYVNTQLLQHG